MLDKNLIKQFIMTYCLPRWRTMNLEPVLIYLGGSILNLTYTKNSDVDIVVTCFNKVPIDYKENLEIQGQTYSILFNEVSDYQDCSQLTFGRLLGLLNFTHFDAINHFGLIWTKDFSILNKLIEHRKIAAKQAVYYLYEANKQMVDVFLQKDVFNKELYHYAHAYYIVFNKPYNYFILSQIKKGKLKKLLKIYINELFNKGRMCYGSY